MKRWLRRIAKVVAVAVVLVVLLPLVVIAALQNSQVRALAVDRVLTEVNDDIPGTIELDRIDGSLLGHARLHELRISDARGNLAAHVGVAETHFRLLPLIRRSIVVDGVAADDLTAVVRTYEDDTLNWDLVVEPDPEPTIDPFDWPLYLDDLAVGDGAVAYLDETADIQDPPPGLIEWRDKRIADLDAATGAHQLREAWNDGFDPDELAGLAQPRAPTAMWATDLEAGADLQMQGHDIEAHVHQLAGALQADILPDDRQVHLDDTDARLSESTLRATVDSLEVDDWIQAGDIRLGILLPTLDRQLEVWEATGGEPDEAFDEIFVDFGWWTIHRPVVDWAAPDLDTPVVTPLHLAGNAAIDAETVAIDAEIDNDRADQPVELAARLDDWELDEPSYDATLRAEAFDVYAWLDDPELARVETTAHAHLSGQGFDPEDLEADLRLRLDETLVDDQYGAELLYAGIRVEDGVIDGYNLGALTPYLDLIAGFRLDPGGDLRARARTTAPPPDRTGPRDLDLPRPDRADLQFDLDAAFDPDVVEALENDDFEDLEQYVDSLDASASWDIAGFEIEPLVRLDDSSGTTDVDVDRLDATRLDADYHLDALVRGFELGPYQLDFLQVADDGAATVDLPVDAPLETLRAFENDARLQVAGLRSPEVRLDEADTAMAVRRDTADVQRADASLDVDLAGLDSDELSADALQADFDGRLALVDAPRFVDALRGDGSISARQLQAPDLSLGSMATTFSADAELGPGDNPLETLRAEIDAEATDLVTDELAAGAVDADFDGLMRLDDHDVPIRELDGRLEASLEDIDSPEAQIRRVGADFDGHLHIPAPGQTAPASDATASVTAAGILAEAATVGSVGADFDGTLQFSDDEMPLTSIDGLLEARSREIDTDEAGLRAVDADFDGQIGLRDADMPLDDIDGTLTADLDEIGTDEATVDSVGADFDTRFRFGTGDEFPDLIRDFDLDGRADASQIRADTLEAAIDDAGLTIDLAGTPSDPTGEVELIADEIRYATEEIERLAAGVEMIDELRRGSMYADATRRDDQRLRIETGFDLQEDYQGGEIFDLAVETERTEWASDDGAILRWTGERAEAADFRFASAEQSIFLDGHFHPDVDQQMTAEVDLVVEALINDLYIDQFVPDLPDLAGDIESSFQLDGTAAEPSFEASADLTRLHYEETGPFAVELKTDYADERLDIHHFDVFAFDDPVLDSSASIPVALRLDDDVEFFIDRHSEIAIHVHPRRLRQFHAVAPALNEFGIDGVAALDLQASGTIDRPRLDADLTLDDFQAQGEIDDEFLDLRDIDFATRLQYTPTADGGEGLDLSTDVAWEGESVGEIDASTPFAFEDWLVAAVHDDQLPAWEDEYLDIPFEVRADVPSLDLGMIPLESLRDQNLAGLASLDLQLEGTVEDPAGHVEFDLRDFGIDQFRQIDLAVAADVRDQIAEFDQMEMVWADQEIFTGRGAVPLPISTVLAGEPIRDVPIDFQWELHDIQVSRLSGIDYAFSRVDGFFGASIHLGGSLRSPEFDLQAGIWETRLGDDSEGSAELGISGADNRVAVDGTLARSAEPFVSFEGDAPVQLDVLELAAGADWQMPGELDFSLDVGPVDLADIIPTHLVDDHIVDTRGLLDIDAELAGTWDEPVPSASIALQDGGLALPEFGRGFENIQTAIELTEDQLRVEQFEVHDGPGSIELTGSVDHDHFIPGDINLSADANDFNLVGLGVDFPVFLTAGATVDGQLLGDPGEIDVHVSNLEVVLTDEWDRALHDTDLDPDIVILDGEQTTRAEELVAQDPDEADGLNLRVNIIVDRDAWARHPAGNINFEADLEADITGTLVAITGSVEALRGNLNFLGRRFDIMESEIAFTGSIPPNPRLRVEAHHILDRAIVQALGPPTSGDPRVEFHVGGTAMEPRLTLQSDPAMTDTEILFVLMTGRPPDRTGMGREEGAADQALAAVSGLFFGMLQDEVAGGLPVDVLRVDPGASGGLRAEAGTYLTPDLFLLVRREPGDQEERAANIVQTEYHFLPRWSVEAQYTIGRNEGQLNLFWDVF